MAPFLDAHGRLTSLGSSVSAASLVVGFLSALLVLPAIPLALVSLFGCLGDCFGYDGMAWAVLVASPVLLLVSAVAGLKAARSPSARLVLPTFVPALAVAAAVAIAGPFG
jgi:hypothetical protein